MECQQGFERCSHGPLLHFFGFRKECESATFGPFRGSDLFFVVRSRIVKGGCFCLAFLAVVWLVQWFICFEMVVSKMVFGSLIWNMFPYLMDIFLCCIRLNMSFSVSKLLLLSTLFFVQRMFVAVKGFPIWGSHFPDRWWKHWLALFIF